MGALVPLKSRATELELEARWVYELVAEPIYRTNTRVILPSGSSRLKPSTAELAARA
jgi:hypothetical protein